MNALTNEYDIEFAQTYTAGSGKNGGGGFYSLYSGTKEHVNVPIGENVFLINHTHPGGTTSPSNYDIYYLFRTKKAGSPQETSVILPKGKGPVKFNKDTPANGKE